MFNAQEKDHMNMKSSNASTRPRPTQPIKPKWPWLAPLYETVFIGYTDIAAAGSRSLLGLSTHKERSVFELPLFLNSIPCCTLPKELPKAEAKKKSSDDDKPLAPFMIYNSKYFQFSFVIINTHIPDKGSHHVVEYVLEACIASNVRRTFLLSAQRIDIVEGPIRRLYENTWNGMGPGTTFPRLPRETVICDAFLNNFIQMFLVYGMPFSLLTAPACRAESGKANEMDGSAEVIATFQETVSDISHLGFSLDNSCSLIYNADPGDTSDMSKMIYV